MIFTEEMSRIKSILDNELESYLNNNNEYMEKIVEAIEYSLFTGGKRIRPILCIKAYELFSGNNYMEVLPYAMSIEMIHTYSLIHDDLPSMDDDDFRRGQPTSHKKFGEAMAILAGDALLNMAFEVVLDNIYEYNVKNLEALKEIAKYAGIKGMIGGQVVDLHLKPENVSNESITYMYKNKTAALIQASVVAGSIIGGASQIEVEVMREFGYNLGMSYQIQDDFLDLDGDREINKITYISSFGEEKSRQDLEEFNSKAILDLKKLNKNNVGFFEELLKRLEIRKV